MHLEVLDTEQFNEKIQALKTAFDLVLESSMHQNKPNAARAIEIYALIDFIGSISFDIREDLKGRKKYSDEDDTDY